MKTEKVCLVTGAAGLVGQRVILSLVQENKKVLALGEPDDVFAPSVLKTNRIPINTSLPVTPKSFKKYDVQFCFGDLSDISFLASIFSSAQTNNIEIEYVIHLTANKDIQASSPKAYHPDFGDTVNLLEVTRAYWQSHQDVFKGFFFAKDTNSQDSQKIEKMMQSISEKSGFPIEVYSSQKEQEIGSAYNGKTPISLLYRFITPIKHNLTLKNNSNMQVANKKQSSSLLGAIKHFIESQS